MRRLSLDSLTLTDTQPDDMIRAAAAAGFDAVSLWVQAPALFASALLTAEKEAACARALANTGLEVSSLECFDLQSEQAVESFRPALERGARLGAKAALAINYSNPDSAHVADLLARFAEMAEECGLAANLEPVAGGHSPRLAQALGIIRASGADVGLCLDPHHLFRSGGSLADLQGIERGIIRYVQICDGPRIQPTEIADTEAICERLYPGDGEFPLMEFLHAAPSDVVVAIECPSVNRSQAGMTPAQQALEAFIALRRLLD